MIFYKPEVARFLITSIGELLEINALDVVSEPLSTRAIAYHLLISTDNCLEIMVCMGECTFRCEDSSKTLYIVVIIL